MKSERSPEQFIPDHTFVYIVKGRLRCYDGNKSYILIPGDYYLFRKNHLLKYYSESERDGLELIRICLDQDFLKHFQGKHETGVTNFTSPDSFIKLKGNKLLSDFIRSLKLYYNDGELDKAFSDIKKEELLIILLQNQPELARIFFFHDNPEKINLEEFMNRNFKFSVSIERFAYLTGRSLSAFKRDFEKIYNDTPSHWLVRKRLQEAHFLIEKKIKNHPTSILTWALKHCPTFHLLLKNYLV